MKDKNILDEPTEGVQTAAGGKFTLAESMMNKKQFSKAKEDIKRIKGIVAEMQVHVSQHHVRIQDDLIDEDRLKISIELLESDFERRLKAGLEVLSE